MSTQIANRWYRIAALLIVLVGVADVAAFVMPRLEHPDTLLTGLTGFLVWMTIAGVVAAIPSIKHSSAGDPSPAMQPSPATPPGDRTIHRLRFHGAGRELLDLSVTNSLRTLLTLGVYTFWAKVKTRQYVWGQTEFAGDRFGFHGTGKELLLGWVKAALLFGGVISITAFITGLFWPTLGDDPYYAEIPKQLSLTVGLIILLPLAIMGSMRYQVDRTSWRGIRFNFHGRYRELLGIILQGFLLTCLTLGLYAPFYQTNLRRFLVDHTRFGSAAPAFSGAGRDLLGRYALTLLFTLPTLGMIWLWYIAFQRRYYWNHTCFAGTRFHCTVTGSGLLGLYAVNLAMIVLSLGLAFPWVTVRTRRFDLENLSLQGPLDLDAITQQAQAATPTGEELSGLLDVDAFSG